MLAIRKKKDLLKCLTGNQQQVGSLCPNCFLGLLTAAPNDTETSTTFSEVPTEIEGVLTGYERTFIGEYEQGSTHDNKMTVEIVEGEVVATNNSSIFCGECINGNWGTATYFGLFNGKNSNDLVAWGQILDSEGEPTTLQPQAGEVPVIRVGQLKITIE